ncbi:unnamed protein product [Brassica oleracea]
MQCRRSACAVELHLSHRSIQTSKLINSRSLRHSLSLSLDKHETKIESLLLSVKSTLKLAIIESPLATPSSPSDIGLT